MITWPKQITEWHDGRVGYLSVPFTWLLPAARQQIQKRVLLTDHWIVGGPAVRLMPEYLRDSDAEIGEHAPGVLQRVNPQATRTTAGCIRHCRFCGVLQIEGGFRELPDWPDLPVLCDNNLLAARYAHFDRVIDRLAEHGWADFNQGLDARLLTTYHATRIAEIKQPMCRLALDRDRERQAWADAVDRLRTAGIAKACIRTYVLCGFEGGPAEDRERCEFVESFGIKPLPMWCHTLWAMAHNEVTREQQALGWTKRKQRELMCWYYQHRTLAARG